jgi:hypothetical protein
MNPTNAGTGASDTDGGLTYGTRQADKTTTTTAAGTTTTTTTI